MPRRFWRRVQSANEIKALGQAPDGRWHPAGVAVVLWSPTLSRRQEYADHFSFQVVAEVLMLTDHAGALLQAAGKSFGDKIPERGVFTADQLGPAIQGIERAIADYRRAAMMTTRTRTSSRWRRWRAPWA